MLFETSKGLIFKGKSFHRYGPLVTSFFCQFQQRQYQVQAAIIFDQGERIAEVLTTRPISSWVYAYYNIQGRYWNINVWLQYGFLCLTLYRKKPSRRVGHIHNTVLKPRRRIRMGFYVDTVTIAADRDDDDDSVFLVLRNCLCLRKLWAANAIIFLLCPDVPRSVPWQHRHFFASHE